MVKKFLGNCLSFPFERCSWTSERRIIEWIKKSLILLWIVYFIIQSIIRDGSKSDGILTNVMIVITEYVKKLPFIDYFTLIRPVEVLLGMTVCWLLVLCVLRLCKIFWNYKELPTDEFPEYNFSFQKNLVAFLNEKPQLGQNIYWLDGEWGTGKTHFLRTFFQRQRFKKLELYYVSCFGITTREQAEQVLIREIEERSSLGSLDHIPVISGLVKWGFKTLGLDLLKKDSVVLFDDLERVAYSENGQDNPQNYNDLLGFIDYLANHKNQKVIVVYNSQDVPNTQQEIIEGKFAPAVNRIPSVDVVIERLTEFDDFDILENKDSDSERRVYFVLKFLEKIYKIRYMALGRANLRQLYQEIAKYTGDNIIKDEIEKVIISSLNSIASSKYFQFMCEEISRYSDYDVSIPYELPPINEIAVRLIDGIKTSDLFDFWWQHQELFEFLMKYEDDYPILSDIKIVTIEDDRYIYEFPKDYDFYINLG